jgi:8-amino-7-oxononanoate synthase
MRDPLGTTPSAGEIESWLIETVAAYLERQPDDIDPRDSFESHGLDSVSAVTLSGDLQTWLGRSLGPTLAWDYPSIRQLARHLASTG